MRPLAFLLLLPGLAFGQELHTFENGEVADAQKINENFEKLSTLNHPEGDLNFNYDDEVTWTSLGGEENFWVTETYQTDAGEYRVRKRNVEGMWEQQGIKFNLFGWQRELPYLEVSNNDICEGTQGVTPYSSEWTFWNEYGSITLLTGWEYFSGGRPHPEAIATSTQGEFYCDDGTYHFVWRLLGATGRYRCATGTLEKIIPSDPFYSGEVVGQPKIFARSHFPKGTHNLGFKIAVPASC